MSVLLHISDTHFGTERPAVVEALLRLTEQLCPALVLWSGDITQRGRRAQFEQAAAMLRRMGRPSLVIPGNHDIPLFDLFTRLRRPYARQRRAFGQELEPVWESEQWLVLGLNTTRPWRHKHGELSTRQIEQVARRLERASPQQRRVVVTHQPMLVTRTEDRRNLLRGHAQAALRWSQAGVDLLLGGHIHLPYIRPLREAHPQLARDVWVVQAGTAVSGRLRGTFNNSLNVLRGEGPADRCRVERWDYDEAARAFVVAEQRELILDRPIR